MSENNDLLSRLERQEKLLRDIALELRCQCEPDYTERGMHHSECYQDIVDRIEKALK